MIIVIQYLAPSHLPIAAEGGCSNTNVMENRETAAFRSSGVAPMSVVNPVHNFVTIDVMINNPPPVDPNIPCVSAFPMLDRSKLLLEGNSEQQATE